MLVFNVKIKDSENHIQRFFNVKIKDSENHIQRFFINELNKEYPTKLKLSRNSLNSREIHM